jgi:lipoprotein-anchoring transpeptidase ErfK/SrfK
MKRILCSAALGVLLILAVETACVIQPPGNSNSATSNTAPPTTTPPPPLSPSPAATSVADATVLPVTLPILDAFFASDEAFAKELKSKLGLTDQQIEQLRSVAREETSKLRETNSGDHSGTTEAARELAAKRLEEIIGEEKTLQLSTLVRDRWRGTESGSVNATDVKTAPASESLPSTPNFIPTDTRIVVNAPAYRMDVFEKGRLLRSYKVGIGYPEFPLPVGLRKARAIIFNPTWTPPDEPWVESPSSQVKVGEKVEAGSKLNPLGVLKIPIGSPSLIHGGKSLAKLGTFASHGCVGLTDALVQDFAKLLAHLGGATLTDADIAAYRVNRTETRQVSLSQPVPVELRYETIVAEDGQLHIYRDVYDRTTNTEENLRAVLEANGVKLEDLTEAEQTQVREALEEMAHGSRGRLDRPAAGIANTAALTSPSPLPSPTAVARESRKVARTFKGKKEVVIEIAALKGKGYPPMAVRVGSKGKAKT